MVGFLERVVLGCFVDNCVLRVLRVLDTERSVLLVACYLLMSMALFQAFSFAMAWMRSLNPDTI
jgi:hypothetical protein